MQYGIEGPHSDRTLSELPRFPLPPTVREWPGLRIDGLVYRGVTLSLEDLHQLPLGSLVEDFRCEEGWVAPGQQWDGVRLDDLLELAGPQPGAKHVAVSAGEFTIVLTLAEARDGGGLLALRLNGQPLAPEHGAPCRLVLPGQACYTSVKWVDRIQVLAERPEETGRAIALERVSRNEQPLGQERT